MCPLGEPPCQAAPGGSCGPCQLRLTPHAILRPRLPIAPSFESTPCLLPTKRINRSHSADNQCAVRMVNKESRNRWHVVSGLTPGPNQSMRRAPTDREDSEKNKEKEKTCTPRLISLPRTSRLQLHGVEASAFAYTKHTKNTVDTQNAAHNYKSRLSVRYCCLLLFARFAAALPLCRFQ